MRCDVTSCKNKEVFADVAWSTVSHCRQTVTLCKSCTDKLWEALSPMVRMNMASIDVQDPGKLKAKLVKAEVVQ